MPIIPSPSSSSPLKQRTPKPRISFTNRATDPESPPTEPSSPASETAPDSRADDVENRLSQVRLRYRSGTGKKAEQRKVRKSKTGPASGSGSSSGSSMYLPAVPLKQPVSGGLKLNFRVSPYSKKINGRIAILKTIGIAIVRAGYGHNK